MIVAFVDSRTIILDVYARKTRPVPCKDACPLSTKGSLHKLLADDTWYGDIGNTLDWTPRSRFRTSRSMTDKFQLCLSRSSRDKVEAHPGLKTQEDQRESIHEPASARS